MEQDFNLQLAQFQMGHTNSCTVYRIAIPVSQAHLNETGKFWFGHIVAIILAPTRPVHSLKCNPTR